MIEEFSLFLDESGTSSLKNVDKEFPVLVLTGVLVSKKSYELLKDEIGRLKRKYFADRQVVLHRRDMRKYEKGFQIFFDDNVKKRFYSDLNKVLNEADYQLISSAINIEKYIDEYGKLADDAYQVALTFILERTIIETDNKNARIHAFIESRGLDKDKLVADHYNTLLHRGSSYIPSKRFLSRFGTSLSFKKKIDMEVGIEIADLCAYPIARYVLNNSEANPAFDVIRPKIRSNNKGNMLNYGIKIYPSEK